MKCNFGANGFRLPTELEWECCARGADETKWEWCWDTYEEIKSNSSIYGKVNSSDGKVQGNVKTSNYDAVRANRVIKDGYFHDSAPGNFMVFNRNNVTPHTGNPSEVGWTQIGFRLCRTIE